MNKAELIAAMAENAALPKATAESALNALLEVLTDNLAKGNAVSLVGFGRLQTIHRAARAGRNLRTGEAIQIPAGKAVRFSPGKFLKETVAG